MNTVQIDYRNLKFLLYQDGKLIENPMPAEAQRVVILNIIEDVAESFRRELRGQMTEDPPGLEEQLLH